jgi:hypothetical protein
VIAYLSTGSYVLARVLAAVAVVLVLSVLRRLTRRR